MFSIDRWCKISVIVDILEPEVTASYVTFNYILDKEDEYDYNDSIIAFVKQDLQKMGVEDYIIKTTTIDPIY